MSAEDPAIARAREEGRQRGRLEGYAEAMRNVARHFEALVPEDPPSDTVPALAAWARARGVPPADREP